MDHEERFFFSFFFFSSVMDLKVEGSLRISPAPNSFIVWASPFPGGSSHRTGPSCVFVSPRTSNLSVYTEPDKGFSLLPSSSSLSFVSRSRGGLGQVGWRLSRVQRLSTMRGGCSMSP